MTINQRKKGHDFERKIAKKLQEDLNLLKPVRRILNQYQEKNHPDLKIGRWNIECKAYKKGFEPAAAWWDQVLGVNGDGEFPALVYKFDNKPIRVRVMVKNLNENLSDTSKLVDLNWESFIYLLNEKYQIDLENHK
ncbi:MAG: hypothetical protein CMB29_05460 [Euryarchaeota archaeon]|nr:hypothetical protein [Euryarchaeota archaeon]|tara:strand:+ start:6933 stop:7340 length:408 start_codon:yes stop_codon:yes gene_type:complete